MKNLILIIAFVITACNVYTQTAQELIKKMKEQVKQLKSIRFEMDNSTFIYFMKSKSKLQADILFDRTAPMLPLIRKMNCNFIEYYSEDTQCKRNFIENDATGKQSSRLLYSEKQLVTIKDFTREIFIEPINKDNLNDKMIDFQMDIFPFFEASANAFLDSLFNPNYNGGGMDMKNISFEVKSDTACLSGDCFLVKISVPNEYAIEFQNDSNDKTTLIEYTQDISYFWINKKNYFPERYRHSNFTKDETEHFNDYRFTRIEKDVQVNDTEFELNIKKYKDYRIEEILPNGIANIQEPFVKAPNLTGITQNGDNISLYSQHAEIYILDFWFSNGSGCNEINSFIDKEIISKYSRDKVMVIGVNPIDTTFDAVNIELKEAAPQFPYILNKAAAKQYHFSEFPGIYILNSKFEVIRSFNAIGERVEKEILSLISEKLSKR